MKLIMRVDSSVATSSRPFEFSRTDYDLMVIPTD